MQEISEIKQSIKGNTFGIGILFKTTSAFVLSCFLTTHQSLADEYSDESHAFAMIEGEQSLTWLPGEKYNVFSGSMGHSMVDMVIEGNGNLPIVISRITGRANSTGLNNTLKYQAINIPRLSFISESYQGEAWNCSKSSMAKPSLYLANRSLNRGSHRMLDTPITFHDGDLSIPFFSTLAEDGGISSNRFPSEAEYVSQSNWYIDCADENSDGVKEFRVFSPDGTKYVMGQGSGLASSDPTPSPGNANGNRTYTNWRVTKVEDIHGNELEYLYGNNGSNNWPVQHDARYRNFQLSTIVASDGREVKFEYSGSEPGDLLQEIVELGTTNNRKVDYDYTNTSITVTYDEDASVHREIKYDYSTNSSEIQKITYPEGGYVSYVYDSQERDQTDYNLSATNGKYRPLISRTTSDGANYTFRYSAVTGDDTSFYRIIDTNETSISYHQKKTNTPIDVDDLIDIISVENGRTLKVRNYGVVIQPGDEENTPLWQKDFTYKHNGNAAVTTMLKASSSVANGIPAFGSAHVVPDTETETIYNADGSNGVTFKKVFTQYDAFGRLNTVEEIAGNGEKRERTITYKDSGFDSRVRGKPESISITDIADGALADKTEFQYYANGKIHVYTKNGVGVTNTYHSNGDLHTVTDALGNTNRYENYVRGIATTVTDASARVKTLTVNDDGTLNTETRYGDTQLWTYSYDEARRLININTPNTSVVDTTIEWPSVRHRIERRANSLYKYVTYNDQFGRTVLDSRYTSSNGGRWETVVMTYDDLGRLNFSSYPANLSDSQIFLGQGGSIYSEGTSYSYDSLGRVTEVKSTDGVSGITNTTEYSTDKNTHLQITTIDGEGNSTTHEFESFGHLSYANRIKEVAADGTEIVFKRDVVGRLKKLERDGIERVYVYNAKQQLFTETHPENGVTTYEYFNNGWIQKSTNNTRSITHYYKPDGQLDYISFIGGQQEAASRDLDYDAYGNLQFLKSVSGTQAVEHWYTYDIENNLKSETLTIDGRSFQILYDHDQLSNINSITYPTGRVYDYAPDGFGYPTQIISNDGKTIYSTIEYHPNGNFKQLNRSSHRKDIVLDGALRSKSRQLTRNNDGKKWGDLHFEYDKASNITKIDDHFIRDGQTSGRYISMAYDTRNRLTSVVVSASEVSGDWEFDYDTHDDINYIRDDGDLVNYHYDGNRHLSQITSTGPTRNFQYNAHGNVTSIDLLSSANSISNRQLTWNAADQLVALSGGSNYAYDGHGLRVKKSAGSGAIYTIYDASGKLRYREDTTFGIKSEYFYVGNDLIARRDTETSQGAGPLSPDNFSATAYSGTAAQFNWSQSVDSNHGTAVSYEIYKDGLLLLTTQNQNSYWRDTGLNSGATYEFEIVAVYSGGVKSAKSNTIHLLMQNGSTSY